MLKPMFWRVRGGVERALTLKKQIMTGSLLFALLPLQLIAPTLDATQSLQTTETWQTRLVLAEETPELLASPEVPVTIEKGLSRYQEEQARLEAERKKREAEAARQRAQSATQAATTDVPHEQKLELAKQAAAAYGIPTQLLVAVWQKESGMRWHSCITSYAGAKGPAQFMPGTWRAYGVDGNGDGVKDQCYAPDAIYAAARYLAANGAAQGDYRRALFRYNNAEWYVRSVLAMAGL